MYYVCLEAKFKNIWTSIEGYGCALRNQKYNFLFLTLTVKNCNAEQLSSEIDKLFHGYTKLMKRRNINKIIKGWFRALEVTHNTNRHSKSYDTYHPHFHVILQVNPSYFTSKDYLKHNDWIKLWRNVMNLDYDPEVYIEKAKAKILVEQLQKLQNIL